MNKGKSKIKVYTLNQSKHISALLKKGMVIGKTRQDKRSVYMVVLNEQLPIVTDYFAKLGVEVEVLSSSGIKALLYKTFSRIALLVSALICIALCAAAFQFVWGVKITGADKVSEEEIKEELAALDVEFPLFKRDLSLKAIKDALTEIEGVALASVKIKGCFLYVDVNEELDGKVTENEDTTPIVAENDCIVTRVVVERGTAMVEVGQSVKKGDVLIAPYYVLNEEGATLPCAAIGTVEGRVFRSEETSYSERRIEYRPSGEEKVVREIWLADVDLTKTAVEAGEYAVETKIISCSIFTIKEKRYVKMVPKEIFVPFLDVKDEIEQELYTKIYIDYKKNIQILNKWCIIKEYKENYTVKCVIETMETVSVKGGLDEDRKEDCQ